jgi:fructose-1,6-bisphosphatase/sedoheptulose 1,7-bisphosphatase-like protein
MDKIIVGPGCADGIDLDAPVVDNLKAIARSLDRDIDDLVVIVLDRPRHEQLIEDIRRAGARIKLIGDGDLSAGISAAVAGTNVHAVMGIGGAPEGVLTAAALRCLNGHMLARLKPRNESEIERMQQMGIKDLNKIYTKEELATGENIIFAVCGVTAGSLLDGVRFWGDGKRTHSLIMTYQWRHIRFIDTIHLEGGPETRVRL